jgi:hypothetical protein
MRGESSLKLGTAKYWLDNCAPPEPVHGPSARAVGMVPGEVRSPVTPDMSFRREAGMNE